MAPNPNGVVPVRMPALRRNVRPSRMAPARVLKPPERLLFELVFSDHDCLPWMRLIYR